MIVLLHFKHWEGLGFILVNGPIQDMNLNSFKFDQFEPVMRVSLECRQLIETCFDCSDSIDILVYLSNSIIDIAFPYGRYEIRCKRYSRSDQSSGRGQVSPKARELPPKGRRGKHCVFSKSACSRGQRPLRATSSSCSDVAKSTYTALRGECHASTRYVCPGCCHESPLVLGSCRGRR